MQNRNYLQILQEEIHTVVLATSGPGNRPYTCALDLMDYDEKGLYFLTARGKDLYARLTANPFVALTGIKGTTTLDSIAISVRGQVLELGSEPLDQLFQKNPAMKKIYPQEVSRRALSVFYLTQGQGEYFDLSVRPIERALFTFGSDSANSIREKTYWIQNTCISCGRCAAVCPQDCILPGSPFKIQTTHCLRCGNCLRECPVSAVVFCELPPDLPEDQ